LEKKKNTPALIESFANARERNKSIREKLLLVGDASYGYDEVNYSIREFGLDNEVIMPGWVEEEDMPYLFNGATAFIFPSRYEGFGIPLLEAMACETPVACSCSSSIPEVVLDAALSFNPHDIKSMTDAIEDSTDNDLRKTTDQEKRALKNWEKVGTLLINNIESA
jgi:glycosyltransferase involved in cell wall biosynthesis